MERSSDKVMCQIIQGHRLNIGQRPLAQKVYGRKTRWAKRMKPFVPQGDLIIGKLGVQEFEGEDYAVRDVLKQKM